MGIIQKKKGFSLIEMVVVIGVITFMLPIVFAIFFVILRQQTNVIQLTEVKRQGIFVSNIFTHLIRNNAVAIYSDTALTTQVCAYNASQKTYSGTLYFKDKQSNRFNFDLSSQKIASSSSIATTANLSDSSKVLVSSFTSQCSITNFSTPIVIFSYDICYKSSTGVCTPITLHFQPTVKLRNY